MPVRSTGLSRAGSHPPRAQRSAHRVARHIGVQGLIAALLGLSCAAGAPAQAASLVTDPTALVNPFIGTASRGDTFPGADVPYGMLQWGPDTSSRPKGGGYDYGDSAITGFSLTHVSGPGCDTAGDVPILPAVGVLDGSAGSAAQPFSHAGESASPGYYSVAFGDGVRTELTTTARAGLGRFTFPATARADLIFKLANSQAASLATAVDVVGASELTGSVTSAGFCGTAEPSTVYFAVAFDRPFAASSAYGARAAGPAGIYVSFDATKDRTVLTRVGISYTSVREAQENRDAEIPATATFGAVRSAAGAAWARQLGRIQVAGASLGRQRVFYTALYHASLHPSVFSDADGSYLGFDDAVHTAAKGHAQYADFSGWDVYRAQAQLTALINPRAAADMAQSMVEDYEQGGALPKWAMNNTETYVMVGDPGAIILADYYAFGARGFDAPAALSAMIAQATTQNRDRPGGGYLDALGYLPADGVYGCCHEYATVSTQLEYDAADFAVSALAGELGDRADQARFQDRAQDWRNVFNPAAGFIQPRRSDGRWLDGFTAAPIGAGPGPNAFAEGDSLIYTGMVPFNLAGLASAMGGGAAMAGYLDAVLSGYTGQRSAAGTQADLTDEPSLELPWEYDYVAEPYKTQRDVRAIQDLLWRDAPDGLPGNDDLGAMSAWYVWSALGMYPETPGTADLALGSPLFTRAVVNPGARNAITINAPAAADGAPYVQSLIYDGVPWNGAYLPAIAATSGATLTYTLGASPDPSWAAAPDSAPPSYGGTAVPIPQIMGPATPSMAGACVDGSGGVSALGTAGGQYTCADAQS